MTTYKYDASRARILRDTPSEKTFYLPGMELHLDKSTSKVTATRYYTFGDTTVAMREAAGVHFLASDHQGTAQLAVDAKTGATTRRRTDPFGNARDASTSSSSGWVNDKGFVGGTVQKSTGLTTLGAREYDSDTGRFISADPIVDYTDPQQINGYAYANNNPVTYNDASGLRLANCVGGWNECGGGASKHRGAWTDDPDGNRSSRNSGYTPAQAMADEARAKEDSAKQRAIAIAKELGKIVADELGITDALDCFTTGNLSACGNTALNVVSSFVGGGPLLKLGKKYLLHWGKAEALAKRIWNLGDDLLDTFNGWRKSRKEADRLEGAAGSCLAAGPNLCHSIVGGAPGSRPYKPFTRAGKRKAWDENAAANGGVPTCELCGENVVKPKQSKRGVTPPDNEGAVDHREPRSQGGSGDPTNAGILCRVCNSEIKNDLSYPELWEKMGSFPNGGIPG
ncbi:RHS repeat-associated core domain-containing protein [Streptomyces sp. NPDC058755]|uniref:RHS repeat-associated core domain-containing protein n=1 Tax=Streptomyces sp. NPDC058755 TaxID=3346624 RepID=UPI0036C6235B